MSTPVWKTITIEFMASPSADVEMLSAMTALIDHFHQERVFESFPGDPRGPKVVLRCAQHLVSQFSDAIASQAPSPNTPTPERVKR